MITYYKSADGYFESYYSWYTAVYTTIYNDIYINNIAEDSLSGDYYYMSADGAYELFGSWVVSVEAGSYFWHESDSYGYDLTSYSDGDGWSLFDAQHEEYAEGTYDYYSSATNDDGVTTTTYRNADGSVWSVVDSWTDDDGNEVVRTFTSEGTNTVTFAMVDGEHFYSTDLLTGEVTITPETYGEIIQDAEGDDIVHYKHDGADVYLYATVDVETDMIVMDGLDEEQNEVNAYIPRSAPWLVQAIDGNDESIIEIIHSDFDTFQEGNYSSVYPMGTFEDDIIDHTQSGDDLIEFHSGETLEE